jgi:hypothetical protein
MGKRQAFVKRILGVVASGVLIFGAINWAPTISTPWLALLTTSAFIFLFEMLISWLECVSREGGEREIGFFEQLHKVCLIMENLALFGSVLFLIGMQVPTLTLEQVRGASLVGFHVVGGIIMATCACRILAKIMSRNRATQEGAVA